MAVCGYSTSLVARRLTAGVRLRAAKVGGRRGLGVPEFLYRWWPERVRSSARRVWVALHPHTPWQDGRVWGARLLRTRACRGSSVQHGGARCLRTCPVPLICGGALRWAEWGCAAGAPSGARSDLLALAQSREASPSRFVHPRSRRRPSQASRARRTLPVGAHRARHAPRVFLPRPQVVRWHGPLSGRARRVSRTCAGGGGTVPTVLRLSTRVSPVYRGWGQ